LDAVSLAEDLRYHSFNGTKGLIGNPSVLQWHYPMACCSVSVELAL
jgi:hypothetical protein